MTWLLSSIMLYKKKKKNLANQWYKNNKYLFLVNIVAIY